jgi:hypothetical protein
MLSFSRFGVRARFLFVLALRLHDGRATRAAECEDDAWLNLQAPLGMTALALFLSPNPSKVLRAERYLAETASSRDQVTTSWMAAPTTIF